MATTNISTEIVSITGVTAHGASDDFIVSAQKFVVASIPKSLLRWAASETVPATHGGDDDPQQVTIPTGTDSIISVRRDSYVAQEVGIEDRGFIASSNSLRLATNTFPKYFTADANRIIVKPDPDSTYKIYVTYVDYTNIGDTSDLRNAVIYHACSSELSKLSTAELPTVSIAAVPPDVPSLSTVSFTQSNALSISTTSPTAISLTSVTFTMTDSDIDAALPSFATATVVAGDTLGTTSGFNAYYPLSDFPDTDPGVLTISAAAPVISISAPGVTTTTIADITTNIPTYTPPVMSAPDFSDANTWVNTEEDSEMLASRMQVINGQITEFSTRLQDSLNEFNEDNAKDQASIQAEVQLKQHLSAENQQEPSQTLEAAVQNASLEVQKYQAVVNDEVQEYSQKLARYQLELNTTLQAWQREYDASVQESI